ncbi:MAG: hypothetical protein ABIC91_00475 [Nanoarchaeota archaeon]|nr:hypothetical protein [Nanoarchaeota archaeon]MBU1030214.1 hypothetical protein [Nanoarchaeota archaeon]MBU1850596.1 hypothetical protein [Nanoarchaeota archaeon]
MDKQSFTKALALLKKESKKRNFTQTIDLIITLKDLNLKNPDDQVDFFVTVHNTIGKPQKVCALVGPDLFDEAKKVCDEAIPQNKFEDYKDKKKAKSLAKKYEYFIAQGSLMKDIAAVFGRTFGPRGKMPNPKVGAVIVAKPQIKPLYERLQKTVRLSAKKEPVIHVTIGKEDMKEEEITDNAIYIFDQLIHHLPKENNNVKGVFIKFTMSKPVKV